MSASTTIPAPLRSPAPGPGVGLAETAIVTIRRAQDTSRV